MSAGYVACFVLPLLLFYDHSFSTPYFYEVILWITYPYSASCASAIVYWLAAGMSPNAKPVLLLDAGANVTVNALDFTPQFQVWADSQMLTLVQGEFYPLAAG
ncbi:Siroheme synthase / Precorrin-2 oxidase [Klebsiella pneumoniae subsp. rhinoscleromatis]|nr:Siroheme synthase / Precorrin-2 oxidase [Klebsiella pneumoniae subsp. rhinoscleromatis]